MSGKKLADESIPLRRFSIFLLIFISLLILFLFLPTIFDNDPTMPAEDQTQNLNNKHRAPLTEEKGNSENHTESLFSKPNSSPFILNQPKNLPAGNHAIEIYDTTTSSAFAHEKAAVAKPATSSVETDEDGESYVGLLQSKARPLGLEIIAPVEADPRDVAYKDFLNYGLSNIMEYLDDVYKERVNIDSITENLDLSEMVLQEDSNVRVYFLKEGTIFRNTLGIDLAGDQHIIFPNASSAHSYYEDADTRNEYTNEDIPLMPGDYVDVGRMPAGSMIDLFLIQDGARNENGMVFWGDAESNEDKTNHAKLIAIYNENTYIIGFEDIPGGGDLDYNDLIIAVEVKSNR